MARDNSATMVAMKSLHILLPLLALAPLASCSKKGGSDDSASGGELTVLVNAPSPSATYHSNEQVPYEVVARVNGNPVDISHATWSLDDGAQEKQGATGNFEPMTAGDHTVHVDVTAAGLSDSRDVTFTVSPPEGDADPDTDADTDTDSGTDFLGSISANIDYHGDFGDFGSPCPGTIGFHLAADGTIAGAGTCNATESGYDFPFTVEGTAGGGNVNGTLVMTYNGTDSRTAFTGHGGSSSTITASYDQTFNSGSDTVRIYGTFSADPQ